VAADRFLLLAGLAAIAADQLPLAADDGFLDGDVPALPSLQS
jgi:hypothetical protein